MSSLTNTENLLKNLLNNSLQKLILLIVRRQTISFNKLVCLDHQMSAKFLCLEKSRSILMSFSNTSVFFKPTKIPFARRIKSINRSSRFGTFLSFHLIVLNFFKNIYSVKAAINSVKEKNESTNNNNRQSR